MPFSNFYNTLTLRDFRLFWYSSSIHVIGEVATFIAQGENTVNDYTMGTKYTDLIPDLEFAEAKSKRDEKIP